MIDITICVGSSCHLKGSHPVIKALEELIVREKLTREINLKGSFCMGDCVNGVCMTVGEKKLRHVTKQNVKVLFEQEVRPLLEGGRAEKLG